MMGRYEREIRSVDGMIYRIRKLRDPHGEGGAVRRAYDAVVLSLESLQAQLADAARGEGAMRSGEPPISP